MKILYKHWHQPKTALERNYIQEKITEFLKEDSTDQDHTTRTTISQNHQSTYTMETEENIIFVGAPILLEIFSDCKVKMFVNDGEQIKKNCNICEIEGTTRTILGRERVALNLIQRLSGIATLTNQYVKIVKKSNVPHLKILDTRKTTPGLRIFEKYAVHMGGGHNHRLNLSDGILIKDNHIVHHSIKETFLAAKKHQQHKIEIEVDNLQQLSTVLPFKPDGVLLDNFTPTEITKAISTIKSYPSNHEIFVEASGGITQHNLKKYLIKGLGAISIGALTHQAKSKNIKLVQNL